MSEIGIVAISVAISCALIGLSFAVVVVVCRFFFELLRFKYISWNISSTDKVELAEDVEGINNSLSMYDLLTSTYILYNI